MKLVVSGGGTGGHVYPGLTIAKTLLDPKAPGSRLPTLTEADLLWIGTKGGMEEEMVRRAGLAFVGLSAGGIRGMRAWDAVRNAQQIAGSLAPARRVLTQFGPDVALVTGGYSCVSVALAAWTLQVPVLIYLPDIVPGLAIRILSRFAAKIAVTSEESYRFFRRSKSIATGYPVRSEFFALDREQARQRLGLEPDRPVLLVFGGSRGARSINRALVAGLSRILAGCQVVHVNGRLDGEWVRGATRDMGKDSARYHRYDYLHDLPAAMVAADLAVARAGAATMGEFPAAGLPAVLVPYPHSGQHQQPNAEYLARRGSAVILADSDLQSKLVPTILALLGDEAGLQTMRESARAMARPDAAELIAEQICLLAKAWTPETEG